jgi:hypothetical protein
MAENGTQLWFEKTDSGIGVRPASFPGRAVTAFWALLCLLALVTYSTMTIMIFVIIFYTAVFGCIVFVKSDLRPEQPGDGPDEH